MHLTVSIKKKEEMERLGRLLASKLRRGDTVLLTGDLGAGKTYFVKEIACALGIDKALVTSPTFSIIHEYPEGQPPLVHADLYRLGPGADLLESGLLDYITSGRYCVLVEWGEYLHEDDREGLALLEIKIGYPKSSIGAEARIVEMDSPHPTWTPRLEAIGNMLEKEGIEVEGIGT